MVVAVNTFLVGSVMAFFNGDVIYDPKDFGLWQKHLAMRPLKGAGRPPILFLCLFVFYLHWVLAFSL